MVQLGVVALSITWLRSTLGHVNDGSLLVVVWRGAVGPSTRRHHQPERPEGVPVTGATAVWEDTLTAEADDEASWRWRGLADDRGAFTSAALAERLVTELQRALAEAGLPLPRTEATL